MRKKTTVIFDMDGVIFDSEAMYMKNLIAFHKIHQIDVTIDDYKKVIGVDSKKFRDIVFSWWNNKVSKEQFNQLLDDYYAIEVIDYKQIINPHVKELLDYLKENNYKIALASSSSEQLIHKALTSSRLIKYFDLIISGNAFQESKPNPEIYLYIINKFHSSKSETLIIEDSSPGIQAAINAEIDVIALKDNKFDMDQSHAQALIDDLLEVKKYL